MPKRASWGINTGFLCNELPEALIVALPAYGEPFELPADAEKEAFLLVEAVMVGTYSTASGFKVEELLMFGTEEQTSLDLDGSE